MFDHGYCSNQFVTNVFDHEVFIPINPMEQMQVEPCGFDFCSMEQLHKAEIPPFPHTYLGGGSGFS